MDRSASVAILFSSFLFLIAPTGLVAAQSEFSKSGMSVLPSPEVSRTLQDLPQTGGDAWGEMEVVPRELTANPDNLDPIGREKVELGLEPGKNLPFVLPNSMR